MNAKPHTGLRNVGGATPNPGAALTDEAAASTRRHTQAFPPPPPTEALLAALSWHTNQAITRQVDVTFKLAEMARAYGLAVAETVEMSVPEGPLRDAMTAATDVYIDCADNAARAATRFGRHFGHLAFAFPQSGT
jgi:hypothetical protein